MPTITDASPGKGATTPCRLWWWVGALFAIQLAVWTAWLVFAAHNKVEEIPVRNQPAQR